jgi:hypothetical protein
VLESQPRYKLYCRFIFVAYVSISGHIGGHNLEINNKCVVLNPVVIVFTVHCHNSVSLNRALSLPFKKRRYSFKMRHNSAGQRV